MLFVYGTRPDTPDQRRSSRGSNARSVHLVFDQVMTTPPATRRRLPATTFSKAMRLRAATGDQPAAWKAGRRTGGEARSNADVFGELIDRVGLDAREIREAAEEMLDVLGRLPESIGKGLSEDGVAAPPFGGGRSFSGRVADHSGSQSGSRSDALDTQPASGTLWLRGRSGRRLRFRSHDLCDERFSVRRSLNLRVQTSDPS